MAVFTDGKVRMQTDPGWAYNPGKAWPLTDRNGGLPDCSLNFAESGGKCVKMLLGQPDWRSQGRPDLRAVPQEQRLPAPALLPAGKTRQEGEAILARALGLDKRPLIEVATPVSRVFLKRELLAHMAEKEADARERYANFILPTLQNPYEIYLTEYEDGFRERYIGLFTGKSDILTVVRINRAEMASSGVLAAAAPSIGVGSGADADTWLRTATSRTCQPRSNRKWAAVSFMPTGR